MNERDEKGNQRDIEIDFINQKRGVPLELSEDESLLYEYRQDVTLKVLEDIKLRCEFEEV